MGYLAAMRTVLYSIWFLLPFGVFLVALWAKLEKFGGRERTENPVDHIKNAVFLLACALVAVVVDQYVLESLVSMLSPDFIPLSVYQILLLPMILVIGAKITGGSTPISIDRAPRPSKIHKDRRR